MKSILFPLAGWIRLKLAACSDRFSHGGFAQVEVSARKAAEPRDQGQTEIQDDIDTPRESRFAVETAAPRTDKSVRDRQRIERPHDLSDEFNLLHRRASSRPRATLAGRTNRGGGRVLRQPAGFVPSGGSHRSSSAFRGRTGRQDRGVRPINHLDVQSFHGRRSHRFPSELYGTPCCVSFFSSGFDSGYLARSARSVFPPDSVWEFRVRKTTGFRCCLAALSGETGHAKSRSRPDYRPMGDEGLEPPTSCV